MFDPLLLKTFVAVVEEQGFGRAAEKLHLTQPAVSGHLRRLEEQVGKPLLKRTTRSQELTLEGDRLMRHARIILALNREAWAEMTRAPFQGRIRVGLAEDLVETRLLRELQNLALGYPGMEIEFQINIPGTLVSLMKQGELDLVVGSLCETDSSGILLWSEPLIWATAAQPLTPISQPLPLALFPEPCAYREAALLHLAQAGIAQRTSMLCTSTNALRSAVLSGIAIAPMPLSQLVAGISVLSAEYGLPPLPNAEFRLFSAPDADPEIVTALTKVFLEYCSVRRQ